MDKKTTKLLLMACVTGSFIFFFVLFGIFKQDDGIIKTSELIAMAFYVTTSIVWLIWIKWFLKKQLETK